MTEIDTDWTWNELEDYTREVMVERDRLREALTFIAAICASDAPDEGVRWQIKQVVASALSEDRDG